MMRITGTGLRRCPVSSKKPVGCNRIDGGLSPTTVCIIIMKNDFNLSGSRPPTAIRPVDAVLAWAAALQEKGGKGTYTPPTLPSHNDRHTLINPAAADLRRWIRLTAHLARKHFLLSLLHTPVHPPSRART